jgi:hypothetical protein
MNAKSWSPHVGTCSWNAACCLQAEGNITCFNTVTSAWGYLFTMARSPLAARRRWLGSPVGFTAVTEIVETTAEVFVGSMMAETDLQRKGMLKRPLSKRQRALRLLFGPANYCIPVTLQATAQMTRRPSTTVC